MTDPRDIVHDGDEDLYLDPRDLVWQEDDEDLGNEEPPDPPDPQEAFPTMVPAGINSMPGSVDLVYVRWQMANAQLIEGAFTNINARRIFLVQLVGVGNGGPYERRYPVDLYCAARVTGGTASSGDYELRGFDGQVSTTGVSVRIPAGSSAGWVVVWAKTDASVEGLETLELTLGSSGELYYPIDGGTPYRVAVDANVGPTVMTVNLIDSTAPPTPEWNWTVGPTVAYPETVGDILLEVALDGPSTTAVTIEFTTTNGTALAGTNYVALVAGTQPARVTIAAGLTTGFLRVRLLNDGVLTVGPNLNFDITGDVISGSCTDPSSPTLTVELIDVFVPTRTIQWAAASLSYQEPEETGDEVTHAIVCSTNLPFATRTDCIFTVTNVNTANGVGYALSSGAGVPPLHVRFEPQASFGAVRFRPIAGGIVDDATVTLTLSDVGGSLYSLGTNDEVVITIQENSGGVEEPTYLAGPRGVRTGRTIVESTMAVVPPSTTLPSYYNALNNEACQVVGLARNAAGQWDAVRVLAMTDDDAAGGALFGAHVSYPSGATGTPIQIELGSGSTPAEAGSYPAQSFTGLTFSVVPCNTSSTEFKRTLTDSMASSTTAIPPQWVGPTATSPMFPQTGPDLVRIEYYRVVLREAGDVTGDAVAPAVDTRCMSVELWLKRSVDSDIVIGEGVLTNTNWDKEQDVHAANTRTDGPVNLLQFEMQDVPAGWAVTWATANPMESFASTTATLIDADGGGAARFFAPCATMAFRFAMYATATSTAAEAQRLLRYRNLATSTGHYGVTRNNIWGVMGDVLIDPVRAGYFTSWSPQQTTGSGSSTPVQTTGWRAHEETGQAFVARARTGWGTGTGGYPELDDRYGWMQSAMARSVDSPSGSGVNGLTAVVPSCGYWEYSWFALAASIARQRVGHKDVVSGDEAWQQVLADEWDPNGLLAPWVQAGAQRLGMHRLPQFNTRGLVLTTYTTGSSVVTTGWDANGLNIMGGATSTYCKAPESRPWNMDEGVADPDLGVVSHEFRTSTTNSYNNTDHAHCCRYREQVNDGWWGCWSPLAWWQSMHLGAWISRSMSAHIVDPAWRQGTGLGSAIFPCYDGHPGFILSVADAADPSGALREKGRVYTGNNQITQRWWPGENLRHWGHAATVIAQAYAIGGDRQRAWIVPAAPKPNWFEKWAEVHTRYTTPAGLWANTNGANLDPYSPSIWGATNMAGRTGALPPNTGAPIPPNTRHHNTFMFHQAFIVAGAWAVYWRGLKNQNSTLSVALRKVLRSLYYVRESARAHTDQQGTITLGCFAVPARGEYESQGTGFPTVPSVTAFIADYWHDFGSGNGHNTTAVDAATLHSAKYPISVYAWRDARDQEDPEADQYLTPALSFFEVPNELAPDWEQVAQLAYANLRNWTNGNNSGNLSALNLHNDHTLYVPFIYEMLNRVT